MSALLNARDIILQTSRYRLANTLVTINATAGAFKTPKNGALTIPANIVLTAVPNNVFTALAVYTWSYATSVDPTTWVDLGTGTTKTITNTDILSIIGDATWVQYKCVVTEALLNTASGYFTITYSKDVSDPIVVDISRTTAVIPCTSEGVPIGYPNTDTSISVSRGGESLTYSNVGGANTFKVSIQADDVARTVGTSSNTSTAYMLSGITNIAVDLATVIFIVTIYDASGTVVSPTVAKRITYTKVTNGLVGGDATYYYIESSSPVISKSTSSELITGTHSNITAIGKKVVGEALPVIAGFLTITANGDVEAALAANPVTTAINNSAGKTSYTIKLYNQQTVSGATLLDTEVIPVLFTGSDSIITDLSNDSVNIPTNTAGTAGIYTGTTTDIHVYEGASELTYDTVGTAPGTWKILSTMASSISAGSVSDSGIYASVGIASNIIADTASVTYNISGTSKGGKAFTSTKVQTFSVSKAGTNALSSQLTNESHLVPIGIDGIGNFTGCATIMSVYLGTTDVSASATYVVTKSVGITATEATTSRTQTITAMTTNVGTVSIAATYSGSTITNVFTITKGVAGAVTSNLSNDTHILPTTTAGVVTYTGCTTTMSVYVGNVDDSANWTYAVTKSAGITATEAVTSRIQTVTAMTTNVGTVTIVASKANYASITEIFSIAKAVQGDTGASGTKSITISAFKWGTAIGTFAQAATYTWSTNSLVGGPSGTGYPTGWTSAAPASTASGQTLYQINLIITAIATATDTAVNWSSAVSNTVGYRLDGTIGLQGNSARVAYIVNTSATPPASPTSLVGDQAPTNWSFTATSTLSAGQFMYQVDGILATGGNIAWGNPYLSNLKVGSLSAISADMGVVNISSTGSLASTGKSFATGSGFYLGYNSTAYKFSVGDTTNYLSWDGTNIVATGLIIKNTAGATILSSGSAVASDILNSSISISAAGTLSGGGGGTVTASGISAIQTNLGNAPAGILNSNITLGTLGAASTSSVANKLEKSGAATLTGPVSLNAATAILVGSTTNGLYLGSTGIVGRSAGATTFSVDSLGNAIFSGEISGATYTTTSGKFSVSSLGVLNAIGGYFSGTLAAGTVDFASSVGYSTTYSTVGTHSIVVPVGMTRCSAKLYGGGGGGGGGAWYNFGLSGGGGGSGGLASLTFTVTPGSTLTLYVGAGGAAGAPGARGTTGSSGGATTISGILSSTGGGGGGGATEGGGWGGTAGTNGSIGGSYTSNSVGGYGGSSPIGTGGNPGYGNTNTSATAGSYASGGGGGGSNDNSQLAGEYAAAGGSGMAILDFFDPGGVVLKAPFETLKSELRAQGHTLS